MSTKLTRKSDRAIAIANRATATLNTWLKTHRKADGFNAASAYDDLIDACPTTVEGITAVVGALAYRQQALLPDVDDPELRSAFDTEIDAFAFIQNLNDGIRRMLARAAETAAMPKATAPLSSYFADVLVRDAFRRAEGDDGEGSPAPALPPPPCLSGAAARQPEMA